MDKSIDSPQTLPNWIMSWPAFDVDWNHSALLLIDWQNYLAEPAVGVTRMIQERYPEVAAYYCARLAGVAIPNTCRLLEAFRRAGRQVVHTRIGALLPDGRDMIARRRRRETEVLALTGSSHLTAKGTYEYEIVRELAPRPDELIVDKNSSSPFNGTGIDQWLRNMQLQTLCIAGAATDMCVETTARDAADRGYNVIVVEDATATFFAEHHRAALSALARVYAQVWDTDRVLAALNAAL